MKSGRVVREGRCRKIGSLSELRGVPKTDHFWTPRYGQKSIAPKDSKAFILRSGSIEFFYMPYGRQVFQNFTDF